MTTLQDAARAAQQMYREGVEELLILKSDQVFTNGEPANVPILFEVFFRRAQTHVRIFCEDLSPEVFDHDRVLAEFHRAAFERNVFVDILTRETPRALRFTAMAAESSNVAIRTATSPAALALDKNFAIMDDISMRVEPNRNSAKAVAVMYWPERALGWNAYFDVLAWS